MPEAASLIISSQNCQLAWRWWYCSRYYILYLSNKDNYFLSQSLNMNSLLTQPFSCQSNITETTWGPVLVLVRRTWAAQSAALCSHPKVSSKKDEERSREAGSAGLWSPARAKLSDWLEGCRAILPPWQASGSSSSVWEGCKSVCSCLSACRWGEKGGKERGWQCVDVCVEEAWFMTGDCEDAFLCVCVAAYGCGSTSSLQVSQIPITVWNGCLWLTSQWIFWLEP